MVARYSGMPEGGIDSLVAVLDLRRDILALVV